MSHDRITKLYYFDELSDTAKERAREWYREASAGDNFFSESVIEDAVQCAEIFGIDIRTRSVKLMGGGTRFEPCVYWSGFWSQGDGACFEGTWSWKDCSKAIRDHAPQDTDLHALADTLSALPYGPGWSASIKYRGHYSHSWCMDVSVSFDDLHYGDGDELPQADFTAGEDVVTQAMRDFADWIYRRLEAEYEWVNADEQVDETIRANEYDFTEDGGRV